MMSQVQSHFRRHRLYPEFMAIKQRLNVQGHICWLAGGAVRDLYLGRECYDFDLVTDANTETLKQLFPKALLVGEKFGVLKWPLADGSFFDLTTFREEGDYKDGRRPSHVTNSTPDKDAARRDFTINALFWDEDKGEIVDYVGGVQDLDRKVLRAVGDPVVRFQEDHLRILRLVRFAAQLDFAMDPDTEQAALEQVTTVETVSGERIWAEFKKLQSSTEWNRALKLPLFQRICQEIFKTSFMATPRLVESRRGGDAAAHLFFVMSNLAMEPEAIKDVLSRRLHLSRDEQNRFDLFLKAHTKFQGESAEKIALEIERKPQLQDVLQYVVYQKSFDEGVFKRAVELLKIYPQSLINGDDLKDLVDVRQMGLALNEVRLKQFTGLVKTRVEAINYIKNVFTTR
jgi:tRNA nucleotidyltransferase/poly(A) polymerase